MNDLLFDAVLEDAELFLLESRHKSAHRIGHRRADECQLGFGP